VAMYLIRSMRSEPLIRSVPVFELNRYSAVSSTVRRVKTKEYLTAMGAEEAVKAFDTIPVQTYAVDGLMDYFHRYALIGGMPEVVAGYVKDNNASALNGIYDSLLISYQDDAGKYTRNPTMATALHHCIETAPFAAGRRITFTGFGKSNYRSREAGEALRTLQRALLIHLIYPSTSTKIPIVPDLKKSPRLQLLDTGLLNYFVGLQENFSIMITCTGCFQVETDLFY